MPLLHMTWNVKCVLQDCLNGEFVRVGPNPKFAPVAGYHWYVFLPPLSVDWFRSLGFLLLMNEISY
jgi:hypothetical protein